MALNVHCVNPSLSFRTVGGQLNQRKSSLPLHHHWSKSSTCSYLVLASGYAYCKAERWMPVSHKAW